jgi:drug/metabolite transporter (DMT)-like permease
MRNNFVATILLLIGTLFWGASFVLIKDCVKVMDVYSLYFWRFFIASLPLIILFHKKFRMFDWQTLKNGILLSVPLGLSFDIQAVGLKYTTATSGAFITSLSVVMVPLFLFFITKKIPLINQLLSVVIATIGVGILTLDTNLRVGAGDIWVFLSAIFYAIYIILLGRLTKKSDPILLTFVQLFSVSLANGLIICGTDQIAVPMGLKTWFEILFLAFFSTTFMSTVQNKFQKYISELKAAVIYSTEPLFAAFIAIAFGLEDLTMKIVIGGGLLFSAMVVSEVKL